MIIKFLLSQTKAVLTVHRCTPNEILAIRFIPLAYRLSVQQLMTIHQIASRDYCLEQKR